MENANNESSTQPSVTFDTHTTHENTKYGIPKEKEKGKGKWKWGWKKGKQCERQEEKQRERERERMRKVDNKC